MVKSIAVLGSTGSIGTQTLDAARRLGIRVSAISANTDCSGLAAQIVEFRPDMACIADEKRADELRSMLPEDCRTEILTGQQGLIEIASSELSDTVITAVVGAAGIRPTYAAIRAGKRIGLANKETLVAAGTVIMDAARQYGAEIIPVDSEHSAIFQCMMGERRDDVSGIILTASGGPFRGYSLERLRTVTPDMALKHPNWKMGAKITIDSATMMNKGFEVIEASHLFDMKASEVEVLVHPQSIVHSLVKFRDGAVKAQLGVPDMHIPIQLALTYPDRDFSGTPFPDLTARDLTFEEPDTRVFRCLGLAYEAFAAGGTSCAIMNAANEIAVASFLRGLISFTGISEAIESTLSHIPSADARTLDEIEAADAAGREYCRVYIEEFSI